MSLMKRRVTREKVNPAPPLHKMELTRKKVNFTRKKSREKQNTLGLTDKDFVTNG